MTARTDLEADLKRALAAWPSGVTVVTTQHGGELWGFTASSFCSLSLRPPLVLVCVDVSANCHDAFAEAGSFAVNILASEQESLAIAFATKAEDKFGDVGFSPSVDGVPVLDEALAVIECRRDETLRRGDHSILIGEVIAASAGVGDPLVYGQRCFRPLSYR